MPKIRACLILCLFPVLFCGCGKTKAAERDGEPWEFSPDGPAALIRTAAGPFWFEFSRDGPRLIPSPQYASLEPFIPWKFARHIAGFLAGEQSLTAAVNQDGFLVFERNGGETALYRYGNPDWAGRSVSSVFRYEAGPAVLLTRDDVFTELDPAPPDPAVWFLASGGMRGLTAFSGGGWETEDLLWDEAWYRRAVRRGPEGNAEAYFRAAALEGPAEPCSREIFLEAARPKDAAAAPFPLAAVLEKAGALAGTPCTFRTVSPNFKTARIFQTGTYEGTSDMPGASAYYREGAALAVLPDGRGIFQDTARSFAFSLPALPEGYAYTASGAAGNGTDGAFTLVAAWEEQKDWNIGAAGFVTLEIELQK